MFIYDKDKAKKLLAYIAFWARFNTLEAIISLLTFSRENSKPDIAMDNRSLFFYGRQGIGLSCALI